VLLLLLGAAGCAAPMRVAPPNLIDGASPPVHSGRFVTIDGHGIHYLECGSGEPLVLVHGFGGWAFSFRKVVVPLSERYRVIAVDLLGFGLSDKPADADYSLAAEAQVLWSVLDSLGVRRAVLLGHSYGGGVVAAAALANPERARGVILANSITLKHGRFRISSGLVRLLLGIPIVRDLALQVAAPTTRDFDRVVRTAYKRPSVIDSVAVSGLLYPYTLKGARSALPAMARTAGAGYASPQIQPARLKVPVMVMWGNDDPWFSAARGYQLAARIPGSSFALVRDAGHLLLEEQPEQCVRYMTAFMDALATQEQRGEREPSLGQEH
jgi:pimeloyl-ACP methyl ester carboxylesterase